MNRFFRPSLFAIGFAAAVMAGCGAPGMSPDDSSGDNAELTLLNPGPVGCERYEPYSTALAEYTLDCIGTIGPESYMVDAQGRLVPRFRACTPRLSTSNDTRNPLQDIKSILSLQLPEPERLMLINDDGTPVVIGKGITPSPFHQCLSSAWQAGVVAWRNAGAPTCPNWTKVGDDPTSNIPDALGLAEYTKALPQPDQLRNVASPLAPPKRRFYYKVTLPADPALSKDQDAMALKAAGPCSAGLKGFYVRSEAQVVLPIDRTKQLDADNILYKGPAVLGDPLWWLDPVYYAPGTDPYMVADYYHPMSLYRDLPGARFGHRNRTCEACSYWNGSYHMIGQLRRYCMVAADYPDGPSCTMTHCEDTSSAPTCNPIPPSGP
jgi:hypothetical protein